MSRVARASERGSGGCGGARGDIVGRSGMGFVKWDREQVWFGAFLES